MQRSSPRQNAPPPKQHALPTLATPFPEARRPPARHADTQRSSERLDPPSTKWCRLSQPLDIRAECLHHGKRFYEAFVRTSLGASIHTGARETRGPALQREHPERTFTPPGPNVGTCTLTARRKHDGFSKAACLSGERAGLASRRSPVRVRRESFARTFRRSETFGLSTLPLRMSALRTSAPTRKARKARERTGKVETPGFRTVRACATPTSTPSRFPPCVRKFARRRANSRTRTVRSVGLRTLRVHSPNLWRKSNLRSGFARIADADVRTKRANARLSRPSCT